MTTARNSRILRTIHSLTIVATLCFILVGKATHAIEQIDQSNLPAWAGGWTHINPAAEGQAAMWQTFTPSCLNLTAVEIDILTISPGQGDDMLTVEIVKDGNILATVECYVEDGFDGLLRFEFSETVPLVPEQIYELTVRDTGTVRFGWKYATNTYERGSRYVFAQERPNTDWFFQTYSEIEPAQAKYSGGTGEPNEPYQIATVEDLMLLGDSPDDYDKHFILTADIDLDPNLPGRKVFDTAVIGTFAGVFDGNNHMILHLTIEGDSYLGLFGVLRSGAEVRNLGIADVNVIASDDYAGGLVATNGGALTGCYSTGMLSGREDVGGLVGDNWGTVAQCYSDCAVSGGNGVGGLMGENSTGTVSNCYSTGPVRGTGCDGGLMAYNEGAVIQCFWDIQSSGQTASAGGVGKTTAEMQTASTFLDASWDFVAEIANGTDDIWKIVEGLGYPRFSWEKYSGGTGEPNDPYQIATAENLIALGETPEDYDKHFILTKDIDLDPNLPGRKVFDKAVIAPGVLIGPRDFIYSGVCFMGSFNGCAHVISNLTINGDYFLGLFGILGGEADVRNLAVMNVSITGGYYVGPLVACIEQGSITNCRTTGAIISFSRVGGLVGNDNSGTVNGCYSTTSVSGNTWVGGLIGCIRSYQGSVTDCYATGGVSGDVAVGGLAGSNNGIMTSCYSNGSVIGDTLVGGLVGENSYDLGRIADCYATGAVSGNAAVGGLVGNMLGSRVTCCYSTGSVEGNESVGGLVGSNYSSTITRSIWDTQTSGQTESAGGTGKTTAEMQMAKTFLDAGWDFVNEMANGTNDIWWIDEGKDYPRLWWEAEDN